MLNYSNIKLPNTIARVLVAFLSFLAADLSFFRLIFSSFLVTFLHACLFPTWKTLLMDLTIVSCFPPLLPSDSSIATVICCSVPLDDEECSIRTSTFSKGFLIVETVLSPALLQEVKMIDGKG